MPLHEHWPTSCSAWCLPASAWTSVLEPDEQCTNFSLGQLVYNPLRPALQAIEVTIQNLIGSGMDPKTENNPYLGFIYTSFQV